MKKMIFRVRQLGIDKLVLFIPSLLSLNVFAENLSPEAIYYRCYSHMTRSRPPVNDPRVAQIKSGQLSYIDACMQIFDLGTLDKTTGRLAVETPESIRVLENFNRFHTSWFDNVDVFRGLLPSTENLNIYLHDGSEPALHFTHAIFHPDGKLEDAVTSDDTWQAIRSLGYNTYSIFPTNFKNASNTTKFGTKETTVRLGNVAVDIPMGSVLDSAGQHNGLHIQMGKMVGIMPMEHVEINNAALKNWSAYNASNKANLTKNFGGGLLGVQSYLMLNRPRKIGTVEDGGLSSSRIYGKQVFREVLCRDLPVVQAKDAVRLVDTSGTNPFPFRNGSSCMQCHGSIDTMGWATRDLRINRTGQGGGAGQASAFLYFVEKYKGTSVASETGPVFGLGANRAAMTDFSKRPPKGHFYFRTHDGKLISEPVLGLSELGDEISKLDDYYICASKRYFEFFTGHSVIIDDSTDVNSKKLNDKEKKIRNYVVDLGKKLHQHQKMRNVVKEIISSDFYKSADYEIKYK